MQSEGAGFPQAQTLDEVTTRLYATTDAMVWAQEWCRITREIEAADDGRQVIDEGWMVGWFANAMCVAEDHLKRRLAAERDPLTGWTPNAWIAEEQ